MPAGSAGGPSVLRIKHTLKRSSDWGISRGPMPPQGSVNYEGKAQVRTKHRLGHHTTTGQPALGAKPTSDRCLGWGTARGTMPRRGSASSEDKAQVR
jgi:hypothetical protein